MKTFEEYCEGRDEQMDYAQKAIDQLKQNLSMDRSIQSPEGIDFEDYLNDYIINMNSKELAFKIEELGLRPTTSWSMGRFVGMIKQQLSNPYNIKKRYYET